MGFEEQFMVAEREEFPEAMKATICYTRIPEGKTRAGVVIGAESGFPLNPGTFRSQHGQVPSKETAISPEFVRSIGAELVPRTVNVFDARRLRKAPALDTHGFGVVSSTLAPECAASELSSPSASPTMLSAYYRCVEEAVQQSTGGSHVVAYCHALRAGKPIAECKGAEAGYAPYAHTDQSPGSWSAKAHSLVANGDFEALPPGIDAETAKLLVNGQRYAVVSAWRKLNNSAASHLAILDHTTCCKGDVLDFSILENGFIGGNYRLADSEKAAARHKWFYFSNMDPEELLLFTAYDSKHPAHGALFAKQDMCATCVHSACSDDTAAENAPPRVSIDVRVLVIWDHDKVA